MMDPYWKGKEDLAMPGTWLSWILALSDGPTCMMSDLSENIAPFGSPHSSRDWRIQSYVHGNEGSYSAYL